MSGILFVISAPSGGGKSTIAAAVRESVDGLGYSISHTTRAPRRGEQDGIDYHFVETWTFRKMIDEGAFLEWATVYDHFYGTSLKGIWELTAAGRDILLDVDIQGGGNIKSRFPGSVLIFLVPPSLELLEQRLRERCTDDEAVIRVRMAQASDDIKSGMSYDYLVVNDILEKAIDQTRSIIISERCATKRQLPRIERMFGF